MYEFGPEEGQKVFFIHGVSMPCMSLAGAARKLTEKGCRVMVMDLYAHANSPRGLPNSIYLLFDKSFVQNVDILGLIRFSLQIRQRLLRCSARRPL